MAVKINPRIIKSLRNIGNVSRAGAIVGGGGLAMHGIVDHVSSCMRAQDLMLRGEKDPYWLLRLKGALPWNAKVLTGTDEITDHILGTIRDFDKLSPTKQKIIRAAVRAQAEHLSAGRNAAYAGTKEGRPIFIGGKAGMNKGVAAHETGHYRADMKRNNGDGSYFNDYMRSRNRRSRLSDIFKKNMWEDEGGAMSTPAYEREAWDLAPKMWDNETRDTALDTYKTYRTGNAKAKYGLLTVGGASIAPKVLKALGKVLR